MIGETPHEVECCILAACNYTVTSTPDQTGGARWQQEYRDKRPRFSINRRNSWEPSVPSLYPEGGIETRTVPDEA